MLKPLYDQMRDTELRRLLVEEFHRHENTVNLIASENIISPQVLLPLASTLSNKYSEGYPGRRYYGGTEVMDKIETLCMERALTAFKLRADDWCINVQALSGSPANLAVYNAYLRPGDRILSLKLNHGGHLSHGSSASAVSRYYDVQQYSLGSDYQVDMHEVAELVKSFKPHMLVAGFSAYPREVDYRGLSEICRPHGVHLHADISHTAGLVAGGQLEQNPFDFADSVMTTTHKTLRGPRGALIFTSKRSLARDNAWKRINGSVFPGLQGGPHFATIASIASALKEAGSREFADYQARVVGNAKALARHLERHTQSRGGHLRVLTGGTDTHLLLADVSGSHLSESPLPERHKMGKTVEAVLNQCGIITNRNVIISDARIASGIRVGTPSVTTRGMGDAEMDALAAVICDVVQKTNERAKPTEAYIRGVREGIVLPMCRKYPAYRETIDA